MESPQKSMLVEPQARGERFAFSSSGWLWLILVIGLVLRCAFLAKESLWLDEVESWWFATDLGRALTAERTNPPLYYTMLHFWIGWFGTSEAGLRSLSVVPGVLSVGLVYALAKRLLSRGIALGAALYQSISSFQIYYSQEARTFAWLVFFILAAGLMLWNALEAAPGRRRFLYFAGYALLGALALYSHFITVFFLAGFGLFVLLRRRKQLIPFIASSAVAVLLFLPWVVTLLRAAAGNGQNYRRYLFLKLPQAYFSFLFGDTLIPLDGDAVTHIRSTLTHFAPLLLGATLSVAVLLPFAWLAWKRWADRLEYALVAAVAPVLLAFLVSFKVMVFDERYLIAAAPFLYIVVAAAIAELLGWRRAACRPGRVRPPWPQWGSTRSCCWSPCTTTFSTRVLGGNNGVKPWPTSNLRTRARRLSSSIPSGSTAATTTTKSAACPTGRSAIFRTAASWQATTPSGLSSQSRTARLRKTFLEISTNQIRNAYSPKAAGLKCRFFARNTP